jgi:AcrR family transcriptional regulator
MGITERKLRQREEMKALILKAAWQIVKEEGWQSLSIRKIADSIEYSIPVIYNHFENKDEIVLYFTVEGYRLLGSEIRKAKGFFNEPTKQLEAMAQAYWNFAFENTEYYQIMFGLGIPACERVSQVKEMKVVSEIMISSIQEAIALGNQPKVDYFLKFHTYWSLLHGLVSIHMIEGQGAPDVAKQLILQDAIAGFIRSLQ